MNEPESARDDGGGSADREPRSAQRESQSADREPQHPIRVVATRTGLTPSALRAWERRYGVVEPARSEGGQRLYSDADIERLALLKRVTDAGRAISRVADLSMDELRELAAEDEEARRAVERWEARQEPSTNGHPDPERYLEQALEAVQALDADRLEMVLRRAAMTLGSAQFIDDLLAPLLTTIGERWAEGLLRPSHEHAASSVVQRVLAWMAPPPGVGPMIVLGTLPGEDHELGAMLASATASLEGWGVTYLGKNLPPEEIASAAEAVDADVVGVSAVNPVNGSDAVADLDELRRCLPPEMDLIVGGAMASKLVEEATEPGIREVASLGRLRLELRDLREALGLREPLGG